MSNVTPEQEEARVVAIYSRRARILSALDFEIAEIKQECKSKNAQIKGLESALEKVKSKLETAEDEIYQLEEEQDAFETARAAIAEYAKEP